MILFFVRRYNDVDHTTPIVYRMAKEGYKEMALLALNPAMDIESDFRLNFLKNQYGIQVDYVYRYYTPTLIHRLVGKLTCEKPELQPPDMIQGLSFYQNLLRKIRKSCSLLFRGKLIAHLWYKCFEKPAVKKIVYQSLFGLSWAESMLKEKRVSLLLFDWQKPGRFNTKALVEAGKKLKIPIITIPHGVELCAETMWTNEDIQRNTVADWKNKYEDYNAVVIQHERYKKTLMAGGIPKEKLYVFGSTRYCREWKQIYLNLIPESKVYCKEAVDKIKVVYMDHGVMFRLNVDAILETIRNLVRLDFVELVVKPSTGGRGLMSSPELYDITKVDHETSSIELVRWADVVMGTTSSIMLEPLLMDKTFIYPKYFHENVQIWELMGACWTVNCYQELEEAFYKIGKDRNYRNYSEENVDRFITEIVYGGKKDRDVLGEHVQFLLSQSQLNQTSIC